MLKTFLPISCFEISYIQNWKDMAMMEWLDSIKQIWI